MSKRPSVKPLSSRMRLPMGRLRDAPIWAKLGLILIVPAVATTVVGATGLLQNMTQANKADNVRTLSRLSASSAALVHDLQNERATAAVLLGNMGDASNTARTGFDSVTKKTDASALTYRNNRAISMNGLPSSLSDRLNRIDTQLSDLTRLRQQITTASQLTLSAAVTQYGDLVNELLGIRDNAAEIAGGDELGASMRAVSALATMKENSDRERVVVITMLSQGLITPELRQRFLLAVTSQEQSLQVFMNVATQWQKDQYNGVVYGADLREAYRLRGKIQAINGAVLPTNDFFTATQWDTAEAGKSNLLRKAETALDAHAFSDATNARDSLQRQVLLETGLLLSMLLVAVLFAWAVARSMARSLRELRHGALTLARFGLPQAVARLRDSSLTAQGTPQQIAEQIAEPLPVRSRDEFGQVAEAFNAVHMEAVRTAAEQAALRASVATMFVNLARRSQILVDRLIGHLDRLERGEEDPDRLAELFQLDHLATRMRRNDENLLVLAGADSSRIQREPAPLLDVLRAAQSEVEHYTRIEFGKIDREIEIAAHSVNDMVHLVAELLDNATAFSPPDSAVMVEARRIGDKASLVVQDRGIGISPDQLHELNERLANPPAVDVAVSRMMGLVVVARLAARHSVKVELRPARERGTIAELTLPSGVLVPRALAGRSGAPNQIESGRPDNGQQSLVPGAPTSPLALGSSSSALGQNPSANAGASPAGFTPASGGVFGGGRPSGAFGQGGGAGGGLFGQQKPAQGDGPGSGPGAFGNAAAFGHRASANGTASSFAGGPRSQAAPPAAAMPAAALPPAPLPPSPVSAAPVSPAVPGGQLPPVSAPPVSGPPTGQSRQLPAWADLTGATSVISTVGAEPAQSDRGRYDSLAPGGGLDGLDDQPLPKRRSPQGAPEDAEFDGFDGADQGGSTRQRPQITPATGALPAAYAAPPAPAAPPASAAPAGGSNQRGPAERPAAAPAPGVTGAQQPPAWPPVVVPQPSDLTTEMPAVKLDWEPAGDQEAAQEAAEQERFVDETMELPIYRELESAWFRTANPAGEPEPSAKPAAASKPAAATKPVVKRQQPAEPVIPARPKPPTSVPPRVPPVDRPVSPAAAPQPVVPVATTAPSVPTAGRTPGQSAASLGASRKPPTAPVPGTSWRTSADEGWQAAAALEQEQDFGLTEQGLPKRVPMSQLVPGGVERSQTTTQRRSPEAVRGLLSAYHRGVQRGRTQHTGMPGDPRTPEPTTAGQHNSQGGKEQQG